MLTTATQINAVPTSRHRLAVAARAMMEVLTLAMTVLAPWAFGAVHPLSILILYLGLSAILVLWSVAIVLERRIAVFRCPLLIGLGAIAAFGALQLVPLNPETLTKVSAPTAALRLELYPKELESLLGEETVYPPAWTISLDPAATRGRVVQLLALTALFAAVRFAVASPGAFFRFALACTINGALLSLLALAQRFSSSPNVIYWSFPCLGTAYGPFVCRNNFPDYANVCLWLGVGLILRVSPFRRRHLGEWIADLSKNTLAHWLVLAVGLMLTGIMFSTSRGGVLALAASCIVFLTLVMRARRFSAGLMLLAIVAMPTMGAIAWFGFDAVSDRLGTLADADVNKGRQELWARTLPLVSRFPFWGTGLGTFETVEPQTRQPGDARTPNWEYAHNDFLESSIEGGVIHLLLVLLVICIAIRSGIRAFNRSRDLPDCAFAIGGVAGFGAVVIHSFGDFGMHIPAVAVLVTVLMAHLAAAGDSQPNSSAHPSAKWLVLPVAATCWVVAVILPLDGWLRERADYYRLAAVRAGNRLTPGDRDTVIRYLRAAVEFSPDDAGLRLRLADAEYEEYQVRRIRPEDSLGKSGQLVEAYLRPALRDYLRLRAANPLYAESHARLAGNRQLLNHPDSVKNYLDRATRLRPTEEGLWYLAGLDRSEAGDWTSAWGDWRRSLLCAPTYLPRIIPIALARLGPAGTVDAVMPPSPDLMLKAANTPPLNENAADRRLFAAQAVDRIAGQSRSTKEECYARAWLLRSAGRTDDAAAAYEDVLSRAPDAVKWRLDFAELLFEKGDYSGAAKQLRQILEKEPNLEKARELNLAVVRARLGIQ